MPQQYGTRVLGGPTQFVPSSSPYGCTQLGEQGTFLNTSRVQDMQRMGIWWLRFFVTWQWIESTNGYPGGPVYNWTETDDAIGQCNAAGISYFFVVTLPAPWHCYGWAGPVPPALPPNPCDISKVDWAFPADAGVFAAAVASRYDGKTISNPYAPGTFLHIEAIECANEGYDDGAKACQDGKWCVAVTKAIYKAVKAVNPSVLVVTPAQLHIEKTSFANWINDFYKPPDGSEGGGAYCDVHQIHVYPGQRGPVVDDGIHYPMADAARYVKSVAAQYGYHNRQVWVTEIGYPQNNLDGSFGPCAGPGAWVQQGCLLQMTLDAGRNSNGAVDKVFLYTLAGSDGYSPVEHQIPNEVFHCGYYVYAGGTSIVPGENCTYPSFTQLYPVWTGGVAPPALAVDQSSLSFSGVAGGAPPGNQTVTLSDTSVTGTDWTSSIIYQTKPHYSGRALEATIVNAQQGSGWLNLVPSSGTLAGNGSAPVIFKAAMGTLSPGTYNATVTFTAVTGGATATVAVSFIVSPASASLLTLYGTNVASGILGTAGTLASQLGGTEVSVGTLIGTALNFGELTALGTGSAWPALTSLPAPTGKGWFLPVGLLDNQTMDAGSWTCDITVRFGGANGQAVTADFYVRAYLYDNNFATYTQLGQFVLLAQHLASNTRVILSPADLPKPAQAFTPGQTLYIDVWPNLTASTLGAGANVFIYESNTGSAGLSADVAIGFPGYSPTNQPQQPSNTYTVIHNGNPVMVDGGSLSVKTTIGKRGEAQVTVIDPTGNNHLQQWEQLSVYDKLQNLVFSGYITNPQETKIGYGSLTTTQLTATDQHYLADKRVVATYYLNKTYGFIVKDLINTILVQEGVTIGQVVDGGSPIPQVTLSYCTVAAALDAMVVQASSSGTPYFWMIDQFKRLFFVPYTALIGPAIDGTTIDDGRLSGTLPQITRANPAYRNTQYVTGGNAATSTVTETRLGDSHTRSWTMGYPIAAQPTITVDGTSQQVGIKGSSGFDFYWAAGDPVITQTPNNPVLTSSNTLSVTYIGQYPSVFTGKNVAQINYQKSLDATSGIVESVLDDNTIASVQDGLNRVGQQLNVYGVQALTFTFATLVPGLSASQWCQVNYPAYGLNNVQMLIEEVTATDQKDGYNLWYMVKAIQGPYDQNWQQFFGNILTAGQPNSINVGQAGGGQVQTPNFTRAVSRSLTFNATVGLCVYPSNSTFPGSLLFPTTC